MSDDTDPSSCVAHGLSDRLAKNDAKSTAGNAQAGTSATLEEAKTTASNVVEAAQAAAEQAKVSLPRLQHSVCANVSISRRRAQRRRARPLLL